MKLDKIMEFAGKAAAGIILAKVVYAIGNANGYKECAKDVGNATRKVIEIVTKDEES